MKNVLRRFSFLTTICFCALLMFGCKESKRTDLIITRDESINSIVERIEQPETGFPISNIEDFGAIGDGQYDCRPAIDKAIRKIGVEGGGKIVFPKGTYFCKGPIHLESKINLHLEKGATILFSQDPKDFLPMQLVRWEGVEIYNYSPYIYARNKTDIAITGKGKLNGNAIGGIAEWRPKQKPAQKVVRQMGVDLRSN